MRYVDKTIDLATDMGALVVASAVNGNSSNDLFRYYPSRSPRVLSVGATEKATRRRAGFSNYGRLVSVFAPGANILTTGSGNGYILISGTSFFISTDSWRGGVGEDSVSHHGSRRTAGTYFG